MTDSLLSPAHRTPAGSAPASAAPTLSVGAAEQHTRHRAAVLEDRDHGLAVPVTEISLDPSPDGTPNPPVTVYRTAGLQADPLEGLPALRAAWVRDR